MKEFYKIDLEMITKIKDLVDKCRFEAGLSLEEKNNLHFMAGYLEGLTIRIEENLVVDKHHVSTSNL